MRKLVGEGEAKLSTEILHAFASKDVSQLTITKQCRYLETVYETNFTGEVLYGFVRASFIFAPGASRYAPIDLAS